MINLQERISQLRVLLNKALKADPVSFDDLRELNSAGLYTVSDREIPIYVGKTTRQGKKRLREMASDFRSHTLNRKLMRDSLNEECGLCLGRLRNKDKRRLIRSRKVTKRKFESIQDDVNRRIKESFQIRFLEASGRQLIDLEHFAIGILSPRYNG